MSGIVIIEDDALMRSLLAEWLIADGYRVCSSELERDSHAELVIVDLFMPRHLGGDRLRAARVAHPGVPIIAISGHFRPGVRSAGPAAEAFGVERVIAKPFGREAFLDVVRSVVGAPHSGDTEAANAQSHQDARPLDQ